MKNEYEAPEVQFYTVKLRSVILDPTGGEEPPIIDD